MPKYPAEPHLFAYKVNGATVKIVRAASVAEAREFMAKHQQVEVLKLTPQAAFAAAYEGIAMLDAKPEYAALDGFVQTQLFGAPIDAEEPTSPTADEVHHLSRRPSLAAALMALALGFAGPAIGLKKAGGMIPAIFRPKSKYKPHQGKRECARRRRQIESGFITTAGHKPRARIEQWSVTRLGGHARLNGAVFGHPSVPDGTRVATSAVLCIDGTRAETRNTVYRLGQPAD